jgi:2-beta-glucuronyltransferase
VPEFSLITCTLGRIRPLRRLLDSLLLQENRDFELILVDQAPPGDLDGLVGEFAGRLSMQHIRSCRGLSRARNVGIRHACGRFIGFPDDDCWYPPDVLRRLARRLDANPNLDLILGKTVDQFGIDSLGKFRAKGGPISKWNVWTSGNSNSIFVRSHLATASGGFDEALGVGSGTRFQSGEETDFVLRILAMGAVSHYDPELKIHHQQVDKEIGQKQLTRAQAYSPGFGRVLRRHRYGAAYVLYRLLRSLLRSLLAVAAFDWRLAQYKLSWAAGTLDGYLRKDSPMPPAWSPAIIHGSAFRAERAAKRVVLISEHDYRTGRRANFQPIADALVRLGYEVTFISVRYSLLSLWTGDSRNGLRDRANQAELCDGVTCYLWRTPIHPFKAKGVARLAPLTAPLYRLYRHYPNRFVDAAIGSASAIVIESGLPAILLKRARALNQGAKVIYYASDNLDMIGAHPVVQRCLEQSGDAIDHVCLASARMARKFDWCAGRLFVVPHGLNPEDFADGPSPYAGGLNAVSVGSGLFDSQFFADVAPAFPDIQFHVIGPGRRVNAGSNVRVYDEMKFADTLPFIKHASFGVAAYRADRSAGYVCDSSMKLMQFEFVGIPAVCPEFAVGSSASRFGYIPGNAESGRGAVAAALAARGRVRAQRDFLTWIEVAQRILEPRGFADTHLVDTRPAA